MIAFHNVLLLIKVSATRCAAAQSVCNGLGNNATYALLSG